MCHYGSNKMCLDSDDSDWEEETHVERILREYYQTKEEQAPDWIANPPPSLPSQTLPTTSYTIIETSKFEEHEAEGSTQGELQIDTSRLIYQTRLESNSSRPSPSRQTPTSCDSADPQKSQVFGSASNVYSDNIVSTQKISEPTKPTNITERKKNTGNSGRSMPRNHTSPSPSPKSPPTNTTIPRIRTSPTKSVKQTVAKQRSIYTQRMDTQTLEKSQYKS
ncbi:hypothetical protein K7432_001635 [Basidiobolus ranarum]|uniref:Uncharacterized protein n=1 Tax=Basidiobolus ranarum TaxID=34480 RepID=A0ABR2X2R2_9FUNG